jgi:hypothetical protein
MNLDEVSLFQIILIYISYMIFMILCLSICSYLYEKCTKNIYEIYYTENKDLNNHLLQI